MTYRLFNLPHLSLILSTKFTHNFVKNRPLVIYYSTSFKVNKWLDPFGSYKKKFKTNSYQIFYIWFSTHFVIGRISYQRNYFNNKNMSISWSNDRLRSYICTPSGAQTPIMTHTKWEQFKRPRNPSLWVKTIFSNYQKLLNL